MPEIKILNPQKNKCPQCGGEGLIFRPSGDKRNISFLEVCSCIEEACTCDKKPPYFYRDEEKNILVECYCRPTRLKLDKIKSIYKSSNIPPRYRYRRLREFNTDFNDQSIQKEMVFAVDDARHFVEAFSAKPASEIKGLYFFGPPGTGKTMLTCLILNELILRYQINLHYIKITRDFFNKIRASFSVESDSYGRGDNIFRNLTEKTVLAIDDFGVQADSEWEKRTLYDLIDSRYENELPTIITSNVSPEQWSNLFEGRVYSRLMEMADFRAMISADYREKYLNEL